MKLFSPDSAHWYQRDGVPLHTVPSLKGEPRPTTLRDARKLGLLPSVTNILGVIAKPELTSWLQEQAVLAALTLPRIEGEAEDAFAKRVVTDSLTTRDGAADFGTAFHHGAQRVAQTLEVDPQDPLAPWLGLYRDWFERNCVRLLWTERTLAVPELGFAGTADLLMEHPAHGLTLVDLKTQGVKAAADGKPGKAAAYKSWCYQLAAYRQALPPSLGFGATGGQAVQCMNLIVNSREASVPIEHRWSEEEVQRGWRAFQSAQMIWSIEKNFEPGSQRSEDGGSAELPKAA